MSAIRCTAGALAVYRRKPARVANVADGKIELALPDGERQSVRTKDIEIIHPGPVSSLPAAPLPPPDLAEAAAMLEGETVDFADFAALVYNKFSPEAAWSAWLLLQDGVYFRVTDDGVTARPAAEVAAALAAAAAKDQAKRQREELLERIRSGSLRPDDRPFLRDVEQLAFGRSAASGTLRDLGMEQTPEKAHRLLLKLGVWDCWTDPFPARAGVPLEDPDLAVPEVADEPRLDLTALAAWAIDDEGNQDPDDAISSADGLLWVHVADVAALVTPGSEADREAESRGANLYLPERTVHMLPPGVTHRLGLGLHEHSPALSFAVRIAADGRPTLEKMALSTVRVTRLSYEEAENRLTEEPVASLLPLLDRFRAFREAGGALRIDLPEVKIKAADGEVTIKPLPSLRSRELVAEAMMAAGAAVAAYAQQHDLPLPFTVQPENDVAGKPETLAAMFAARRGCTVSTVQSSPGKHSGLGLEPYCRVTSPLRRYGDLLAHQQLRRHLAGQPLQPAVELDEKLACAERAGADLRKLERLVNEYWKLVYLERHPGWEGLAVMVDKIDDRLTFLLPDLAYEYKLRLGGRRELGSEWSAAVNAVDLPGLTARFTLTPAG